MKKIKLEDYVMNGLLRYLETSYTAYQAVENAVAYLREQGFSELNEQSAWNLSEGGKYYVVRNGSSIVAFTVGKGNAYKIIASHTDSPALKLKEHAALHSAPFTKLNTEPYGGALYYTFFDRPLKIAGRIVREKDGILTAQNYVSDTTVSIPSLAVHMNRDANDKFAPNPQVDLLPLLSLGEQELDLNGAISYDLFAVCAEAPFVSGANNEFVSSPRVDNLTSVYSSLCALAQSEHDGICVAACFDNEEVGSRTLQGAGSDFLANVLERIAVARGLSKEDYLCALASSFVLSLDNAHSLHPNHPEKCDPTNRAVMGGGVVIKGHAGGAYTTDALSSAIVKKIFADANVRYQTFYNRSDMRSGSTLGTISISQVSIPSADLGIAQLAMHSAVELFAAEDYFELEKGLSAFYDSTIELHGNTVRIK